MNAEILSIGTEMLMGQIVNTDAQYLSRELNQIGINVYYHTSVGDNPGRIRACLELALERSDLILTTGGLGPTEDDLTKETIAQTLELPMELDEKSREVLVSYFEKRGRSMTENNLKQCYFPKGSIILENARGTAPGCIVPWQGKYIIVLPGPPYELEGLYQSGVLPFLETLRAEKTVSRYLRIVGVGESEVESRVQDIMHDQANPSLAPYITSEGEVTLRLTVRCGHEEDAAAYLDPLEKRVRERLGDMIYGSGERSLPFILVDELCAKGLKIALAESCTGGLATTRLVGVPGVSGCLIEGLVTYANEAKVKLLDVDPVLLDTYGAVSDEVAGAMAEGLLKKSGANITLAISGIAGPGGGTAEKPVGLVHFAVASANGIRLEHRFFRSDREHVRTHAAMYGLYLMLMEARKL